MKEVKELQIGEYAPDFELLGNDNKIHKLSDYLGERVILYFYPKDDTPGCKIQATDFTKFKKEFENIDYKIIGISLDNYKSHCQFIDKYDLEILLLSDDKEETAKEYKVWHKGINPFNIKRSTFVVSRKGRIKLAIYGVKHEGHAKFLLDELTKMDKEKQSKK